MKIILRIGIISCLLLTTTLVFSQSQINFMNGKHVTARILNIDTMLIKYKDIKHGVIKNKIHELETFRVFSIQEPNGNERIFYRQDTTLGKFFTQDEMKLFIYGEQDAMRGYRATIALVSGFFLSGAAASYIGGDNFLVIPIPFVSTLTLSLLGTSVKRYTVRDKSYLTEYPYRKGYKRVAKNRKFQNALIGSIAGTVAGILFHKNVLSQ